MEMADDGITFCVASSVFRRFLSKHLSKRLNIGQSERDYKCMQKTHIVFFLFYLVLSKGDER